MKLRFILFAVAWIAAALCPVWAFGALRFDFPKAGTFAPIVFLLALLAAVIFVRGKLLKLAIVFRAFAVVVAWWLTLKPSNNDAWQSDVARGHGPLSKAERHKFSEVPDYLALCLFGILFAVVCIACLSIGVPELFAQQPDLIQSQVINSQEAASKIPIEELDSLVAPIALYPDPLLAQTLAASTYPLEVIQLKQWMTNNRYLKDQALADAVEMQPWDPSVQAMVAFPDVVNLLGDNIAWMTDLGNAFLAQQGDVMDAVQRMRATAQKNGNLNTTPEQTVQMQTVGGGEQAIVIGPADPEMLYVPSYDPTVVYGSSAYAYPTLYYASPAYYRAGGALAFGAGVALGAAWGGTWGYGCKWANGDININYNNKYVSNSNKNRNINYGNRPSQRPAGGTWQHNSQHRGGAPYADRRTANKYAARSGSQAAAAGTNRSFSGLTAGNPGINRAGGGAGFSSGMGAGASAP